MGNYNVSRPRARRSRGWRGAYTYICIHGGGAGPRAIRRNINGHSLLSSDRPYSSRAPPHKRPFTTRPSRGAYSFSYSPARAAFSSFLGARRLFFLPACEGLCEGAGGWLGGSRRDGCLMLLLNGKQMLAMRVAAIFRGFAGMGLVGASWISCVWACLFFLRR